MKPIEPALDALARGGLCLAYVYSGVAKLLDFPAALAEQTHFGLRPPLPFALATIAVQLGGSAAVLFGQGRVRAFGALALAGFTVLATLFGHAFWTQKGLERFHNLNSFLEHVGLVGGFLLSALRAWPVPASR